MSDGARLAREGIYYCRRFGRRPAMWFRAPGRVDLMGSHTDYNLGYVLTMAIDLDTWLAVTPRDDGRVKIISSNMAFGAEFALADIEHDPRAPWTDYVRGVADVLQKEGHHLQGFNGLVHSTVPIASGLSSSAALEVVAAVAWRHLGQLDISDRELALLCQRAENEFVGLNCGILDQYSSLFGREGHALLLDCLDLMTLPVPIQAGISVVICDTKARRQLTGSEYSDRRAQCEEGVRLLAQHLPQVTSLRDVSLDDFRRFEETLPPVVARRCRFIIEENRRVMRLSAALDQGDQPAVGALCAASYSGARDLYEIVSLEMELMMEAMMASPGLIGARQAGAGFGGCMVAFVRSDQVESFSAVVASSYQKASGIEPRIYPVKAVQGAGLLPGYE
jgi:galactokinase